MKVQNVLCDVGNEFLNIISINLSLQSLNRH